MDNLSLKNFFRVILILFLLAILVMLYRIYEQEQEKDEYIENEFNKRERRLRRRKRLESTGDRFWCYNNNNKCKYMDFDKCERLGYETYLSKDDCLSAKRLIEERQEEDII